MFVYIRHTCEFVAVCTLIITPLVLRLKILNSLLLKIQYGLIMKEKYKSFSFLLLCNRSPSKHIIISIKNPTGMSLTCLSLYKIMLEAAWLQKNFQMEGKRHRRKCWNLTALCKCPLINSVSSVALGCSHFSVPLQDDKKLGYRYLFIYCWQQKDTNTVQGECQTRTERKLSLGKD